VGEGAKVCAGGGVAAAGIIGFGDKNDPTVGGPYPTSADIPIRYVDAAQGAALKQRIGSTEPYGGGSPTYTALDGAYKAVRSFQPAPPLGGGGKKIVVLVTDSKPTSNAFTTQEAEISACLARAEEEATNPDPVLTFAVGVGPFPGDGVEYDSDFVGRLAYSGGTARFPGCNPTESVNEANVCHFQVTPNLKTAEQVRQDAVEAINAIRENITSCSFAVKAPPNGFQLDARSISVRHKAANGAVTTVAPGTANGWSVDNAETPKTVTLNGEACVRYRQTGGSVEVLLACR
jgi:hypothetical protein